MRQPTFIDMFCGAGLYSAGWVRAGMTPVLAIDLSSDAVSTYNANLPPVAVHASVLARRILPLADVLVAGPPCQGFSTLGRMDPLDVRNDLALTIPEWAEQAMARVVVIENVPPFIRSRQWAALTRSLAHIGYAIQVWELDAVEFNTPQLRRRAFTIASLIGSIDPPVGSRSRLAASAAFDPPIDGDDPMHRWPTPATLAASRIALIPMGGDKRDVMRSRPDLCPPSWARVGCHATDAWGRIDPGRPSNTIRCTFQNPSKGRYLHPIEDRMISLREGARLQGVPDAWQFTGRPYPVARQIGNGVPIPLAFAVATAVGHALASVDGRRLRA